MFLPLPCPTLEGCVRVNWLQTELGSVCCLWCVYVCACVTSSRKQNANSDIQKHITESKGMPPNLEIVQYSVNYGIHYVQSLCVSVPYSPHPPHLRTPRYLVQNLEWLEEGLGDHDNDYYLFDCPGVFLSLHV